MVSYEKQGLLQRNAHTSAIFATFAIGHSNPVHQSAYLRNKKLIHIDNHKIKTGGKVLRPLCEAIRSVLSCPLAIDPFSNGQIAIPVSSRSLE
jgi:hypothetical protein